MSKTKPAVFLDRDGVINVDHGYVSRIDQFDWIEGAFETVAIARRVGYEVVVVTNQAGIAKGKYDEADFHRLNDWMMRSFAQAGAALTAVYYCPYHPDGIGRYRKHSAHRKPGPGMLHDAARDWDLELALSLLIGDKETDIQAGRSAGVKATALFANARTATAADAIVSSHREAAEWITRMASA